MRALNLILGLVTLSVTSTQPVLGHSGDNLSKPKALHTDNSLTFIENKGQWNEQARFRANLSGAGTAFFTNSGIVYNYSSIEDLKRADHAYCEDQVDQATLDNIKINNHAFKVVFKNANTNVTAIGEQKQSTYHNYFIGNDPSKWASRVGLFHQAKFQNVYNGIDVAYYGSKNNNLKYDFIVKAGANPGQIQLGFDGVTPYINEGGDLVIKTSVNEVVEKAPYTYQVIDGKEVAVASKYNLKKGVLSFDFPNGYNANYDLIIDPELVYATYSGGSGSGSGMYSGTTTYDQAANTIVGAKCYHSGWPVTMGSFQTAYQGSTEAGFNKYNALGTAIIFSTYYGGSSADVPVTVRVNSMGELVAGGKTSSTNLPMVSNPFKAILEGGTDIFLARFSEDGTQLLGSTYVGTTDNEMGSMSWGSNSMQYFSEGTLISCGMEINFDINDNIWMVTATTSTSWPTTSNAMQLSSGGGVDGVVMKFTPNLGSLLYSSYIGGAGNDVIYGIELLANGNPVICGATSSTDFPMTQNPFIGVNPGGNSTGFLAVINNTAGTLERSTYVGTPDGAEQVTHVQVDGDQNIVALVRTNSTSYPATTGTYTNNLTGTNKLVVQKFNTNLTASPVAALMTGASTFFPSAFVVDVCGNAYVATMNAGANMPASNDAFQTFQDDFYLYALDRTYTELIFGSYFGDNALGTGSPSNDHCHMGVNRLDPQGIVYHSICNNSGSWLPAVYGGAANVPANLVGTTKPSGYGQDILTFKFNFDKTGVQADMTPDRLLNPKDSGCAPHTVVFQNVSQQAQRFEWYFGDGGTSTLATPTHTYTQAGDYTVMFVAVNDSTCITHDTAYLLIRVYEVNAPILSVRDTNLCVAMDSLEITVDVLNPSLGVPGNVFRWTGAPGSIYGPGNTQSIWINPSLGNVFNVTVLDSAADVCNRSTNAVVNVNMTPRELQILTPDTAVCHGAVVPIRAVGSPGYTYRWSPTLGVSDTNALSPNITVTQSDVYMITASYPHCIDTSDLIYITKHEFPVVDIIAPTQACEGSEVTITSDVTPYRNDYIYRWEPQAIIGAGNSATSATFIADTVDRFYRLTVETPIGCSGADSAWIVFNNIGFGDAISGVDYCPPGSAQLWAANGVSYQWNPATGLNDPNIANPITTTATPIDYEVYITDANGCTDTLTVVVDVHPRATLSIPDSVTVYPGGPGYQVTPNTNALYFDWYPPSGVSNPAISDPVLNPIVRTRYFVTASTEFGCEVVDSIDVLVGAPTLNMPNAYNPNNPEQPLYKPVVNGGFELKSFNIYNRWGTLLYESTDLNAGWDGKFKDQPQPFGVYVWVIEAVSPSGQTIKQTGNVTLIR